MLTITIFLPLLTGLVTLLLPARAPRLVRWVGLAGAVATLAAAASLWAGYEPGAAAPLQWRTTVDWIPAIGARYDVAVDGLSLPLVLLTAVLLVAVMAHVLPKREAAKGHSFLFLLMATGLIGLFSAQDLLLFYLFFEVALVPMYFIIGVHGHEQRRYAAMKFFLYTRGASLAMLLAILALYLTMDPHTFSLPAIVAARPTAGRPLLGGLVLLGLLIGFGVKLPLVPLHNWLPDAHVEAPTEGSVILAGVQLKMGGYGLLRVLLPAVPDAATEHGWWLVALGLVSIVYGAFAALGQRDFKRLVAYTSVNHMGYVALGAGVAALATDPSVRALALTGAAYQMVSHGLLTGGMFFMAGLLRSATGTRDMGAIGGLMARMPVFAAVLGVLAFGSLGLPGLSGFVAEFQVLGATVSLSLLTAAFVVLGLLVTTGLYLRVLSLLLLRAAPDGMPSLAPPGPRELSIVSALAGLSLLIGLVPAPLVALMRPAVIAIVGGA